MGALPKKPGLDTKRRRVWPKDASAASARWEEVVAGAGPGVFDEAQHWPELFRRLRGAIAERRKQNGRFILLGSIAPSPLPQFAIRNSSFHARRPQHRRHEQDDGLHSHRVIPFTPSGLM